MEPPWKKNTKQPYQLQEARSARKPGARAQLNSGRTWSGLRDVVQQSPIGRMLIDNKTTEGKSFTITEDDWKDFKRDANRTPPGCSPAFQIDIRNLRLIVLEEELWDDALNYIRLLETMLDEREQHD